VVVTVIIAVAASASGVGSFSSSSVASWVAEWHSLARHYALIPIVIIVGMTTAVAPSSAAPIGPVAPVGTAAVGVITIIVVIIIASCLSREVVGRENGFEQVLTVNLPPLVGRPVDLGEGYPVVQGVLLGEARGEVALSENAGQWLSCFAHLELTRGHRHEVLCVWVVSIDVRMAAVGCSRAAVGAAVAGAAPWAWRAASHVAFGPSNVIGDVVGVFHSLGDLRGQYIC